MDAPHRQPRRRQDLADRPCRQPERRLVERAPAARARGPAGGGPAPPTPMPSPCRTASPRGVAFAEAEFLAGWIAPAPSQARAFGRAKKHFQALYDGVATDVSKSRAGLLAGPHATKTAGRGKEANEWYGRAASFGQTFYGQLAARKLPAQRARACPAIPSPCPLTSRRSAAASSSPWARLSRPGRRPSSARGPSCLRLARMITTPGETAAAGPARHRAQAPRRGADRWRVRRDRERRHLVRYCLPGGRSRRHGVDRAGAGARGNAPGELIQRRRGFRRPARSA